MLKKAEFNYNAPQFVDFTSSYDDSDGADQFFDVESEPPSTRDENKENTLSVALHTKQEPVARHSTVDATDIKIELHSPELQSSVPKLSDNSEKEAVIKEKRLTISARRRSRVITADNGQAMGTSLSKEADNLSEDIIKLSVKAKKRTHFDGIPLIITEEKQHSMETRKDEHSKTPRLELRTRSVNKDLASKETRKRKSVFNDIQNTVDDSHPKYMAIAEQILRFQKNTPPRFHTSRRRSSGGRRSLWKARQSYNPRTTVAITPKLMTSFRSRPSQVPSHQEKEEQEVEEMMKHQIKAMPLNEKVLQPPKPLHKAEKPTTVQVPFNITDVFKKPAAVPEAEPYKFTAKPLPKHILERPVGIGRKSQLPITVPQSPAITKPYRLQNRTRVAANNIGNMTSTSLNSYGLPTSRLLHPKKTEPKPFSFEVRDKELMEKKENKIKEILEAEKKAREFKATPAPHFKHPEETNRILRHSHLYGSKSSCYFIEEEPRNPFKARSPKVLRQPPFLPKVEHSHSQPLDIKLRTERRAQERQEFEVKQMEKEERLTILKEQQMLEKLRQEEEAVTKLRQEIVHKAQPMPKFKSPKIFPASLKPLTEPKSPKFSKRTRASSVCSISTEQLN